MPKPVGIPAAICGQGLKAAELVSANQNMPTGSATAPVIMRMSLFSFGRPSASFGDSQVFVVAEIRTPARMTPIRIEMSGRLATVWSHPRSCMKDVGYAKKKLYRRPATSQLLIDDLVVTDESF